MGYFLKYVGSFIGSAGAGFGVVMRSNLSRDYGCTSLRRIIGEPKRLVRPVC